MRTKLTETNTPETSLAVTTSDHLSLTDRAIRQYTTKTHGELFITKKNNEKITMSTLLDSLLAMNAEPNEKILVYINLAKDENRYIIEKRPENANGGHKPIDLSINELEQNKSVMCFLKDIINENWLSSSEDISIPKYIISRRYLLEKIEQLNEFIGNLSDDQKDDYQRVLYATLAIKFYLDKKTLRIPFPSIQISWEEANADFETLKDQKNRNHSKEQSGKKAVGYFTDSERVKCGLMGHKPLIELFNCSTFIGRLVNYMRLNGELSSRLLNKLYSDFVPSQFRPFEVQKIVSELNEMHNISIENYFNPCGGWGDRLVGALATPTIKRYIETDPNKALISKKKEMSRMFNTDNPCKDIYLYDKPVEDLTLAECAPNGIRNDLVFYSPPYFNMEKYPDQDGTQSRTRYPTYQQWLTFFLMKSVDISYKALQPNRFFAINIAIISDRGKQIDLPSEFIIKMENLGAHFEFLKKELYSNVTRRTSLYSSSYIYIYKTKEIIEHLNHSMVLSVSGEAGLKDTSSPEAAWNEDAVESGLSSIEPIYPLKCRQSGATGSPMEISLQADLSLFSRKRKSTAGENILGHLNSEFYKP